MAVQFERYEVAELHLAEVPVQVSTYLPEQPSAGSVVSRFQAGMKAFVGRAPVPETPILGEGLLQQEGEVGSMAHGELQTVGSGSSSTREFRDASDSRA